MSPTLSDDAHERSLVQRLSAVLADSGAAPERKATVLRAMADAVASTGMPMCRVVPFTPGCRPTDEESHPGMGSSDAAALVLGDTRAEANQAYVLFENGDLPADAVVQVTATVDGVALPGWERRPVPAAETRARRGIALRPDAEERRSDLRARIRRRFFGVEGG